MKNMQEKQAEEAKKINLPTYLNPNMVNVQQFKQVQDKRKLLWSKPKDKVNCYSIFEKIPVVSMKVVSHWAFSKLYTLRELIFAVFADLGPNRKIKFPQNFSNARNKGRIIHRTALIFFEVKNPQN